MGIRTVRDDKEMGACGIAGIMSERGSRFSGEAIIRMMANMRVRENGLGGGFTAYGIYPEHEDHYALHVMYDTPAAKLATEKLLSNRCVVHGEEMIPTRPVDAIRTPPILHRYFVTVKPEEREANDDMSEDDIVVEIVMTINATIEDAFVFSSGKNMGVFKGVGFAVQIAEFFRVESYEAYIWTGHGRFPTNTTGWWGGAHPFSILGWSIVHNGEISSYGINRRYLETFGYQCMLKTDTEVIAYMFDLLVRKHGLSFEVACMAMAPPFWDQIERMPPERQAMARAIRSVYGSALLNGPFAVVVGHNTGMIGFNDRIKLRPMASARKGDMLYIASEEGAIREVCADPDTIWYAEGGAPVIGELKREAPKEPLETAEGAELPRVAPGKRG